MVIVIVFGTFPVDIEFVDLFFVISKHILLCNLIWYKFCVDIVHTLPHICSLMVDVCSLHRCRLTPHVHYYIAAAAPMLLHYLNITTTTTTTTPLCGYRWHIVWRDPNVRDLTSTYITDYRDKNRIQKTNHLNIAGLISFCPSQLVATPLS